MPIDLKSLGTKIARYRGQLDETVEELAIFTGIPSERLNRIESGDQEPTGDEVLIIADHFRCDFKFFLSDDGLAPFEQTKTLYRAHGAEFTRGDRRAIQDFLYLCETEEYLSGELSRARKKFEFIASVAKPRRQAEEAAAALRTFLGYADHQVPRDVYQDFREIGIHVFRRKLGSSNISGLFVMHPAAGRCALVNVDEDIYRQRFSAAHEAAHAIFDSGSEASVSFIHADKDDPLETRANRFASCYLMPPAFLAQLPDPMRWTNEVAVDWANKLRVSCEAMAYALRSARLVDWETCKRIRSLRVPKEMKLDPELPASLSPAQLERKKKLLDLGFSDFYVSLCFDAFREGRISLGRLAEALLTTPEDAARIGIVYGCSTNVD